MGSCPSSTRVTSHVDACVDVQTHMYVHAHVTCACTCTCTCTSPLHPHHPGGGPLGVCGLRADHSRPTASITSVHMPRTCDVHMHMHTYGLRADHSRPTASITSVHMPRTCDVHMHMHTYGLRADHSRPTASITSPSVPVAEQRSQMRPIRTDVDAETSDSTHGRWGDKVPVRAVHLNTQGVRTGQVR